MSLATQPQCKYGDKKYKANIPNTSYNTCCVTYFDKTRIPTGNALVANVYYGACMHGGIVPWLPGSDPDFCFNKQIW